MSPVFVIALFWIVWWTILFAIIPIGVKSQLEAGEVVPGTEAGAPTKPRLVMKAALTTLVTTIIVATIYVCIVKHLVSLDAIPFGPRFVD